MGGVTRRTGVPVEKPRHRRGESALNTCLLNVIIQRLEHQASLYRQAPSIN